jgi:uncharacterized protein YegP (UPF0339 family)
MKTGIRRAVLPLLLGAAIASAGLHFAAAQDKKDKDKAAATAVFELYKDSGDEYRFRLKDGEGTILATSGKGYKTKADCQKVIDAVKAVAAKAKVEEAK